MKIFNTPEELVDCGYDSVIQDVLKMDNDDVKIKNYTQDVGGPICLIETEEDLKQITVYDSDFDDSKSLFESTGDFDVCELIAEDMLLIVNITNNAGGSSYYVPKSCWNKQILDKLANIG
jgi:hypothetical protein